MDLSKYNPNTDFLLYKTPNGDVKVDVLLQNETIWMPQKKIAELFDVKVPAISKHLKNIFKSEELDEKVVVSILEIPTQHVAITGKIQNIKTRFYNLDAIIAVGYRVNSKRATQFRIIGGQSEKDFFAKLTISYKEARETHYWIRLLTDTDYLSKNESESLLKDAEELLKIIGSIQKTMRNKLGITKSITN